MKEKDKHPIESKVNAALSSFKSDIPPSIDPWFYERLTNRIKQEQEDSPKTLRTGLWGVLKPGLLTGLVALNVIMMVWMSSPAGSTSDGRDSNIQSLASQYGLNNADAYLLTGEE